MAFSVAFLFTVTSDMEMVGVLIAVAEHILSFH